jgi:hypothetical protein
MYPHERSLVKRMQNAPFVLVGINSDPMPVIRARMREEHIAWPFFWDGGSTSGPIARAWNVESWPTLYVIDAKGVIRYRDIPGEQVEPAVETLLKEMGIDPPPKTE